MVSVAVAIVYNLVSKCRLGKGEVYTYTHIINGPVRTAVKTDEHSRKAVATGDPEYGVKDPVGYQWFQNIM